MTTIEKTALEAALSAAFHGGEVARRELRLTPAEADYLRQTWQNALLSPLPGGESLDKSWYEVRLAPHTA